VTKPSRFNIKFKTPLFYATIKRATISGFEILSFIGGILGNSLVLLRGKLAFLSKKGS
jgi:hypothetical protein